MGRMLLALAYAVAFSGGAVAADTAAEIANAPRLEALYREDQQDRKGYPNTALTHAEIKLRDEARRQEIHAMLAKGQVRTAQDFFYSAVIFHHGQTNDHYRLGTSLAWIAATLEPENKKYLWLTASSWDRMLVKRGKPQWYGAQPRMSPEHRQEGFHPIDDTAVTDEERARFQVKPLARLREHPEESAKIGE